MALDVAGAEHAIAERDRCARSALRPSTPRSASAKWSTRTWRMRRACTRSRAARMRAHARLIAFGGAAPLHAARVAEKLGIGRVLMPANAGVGSAVGLLRAPVAYEIVRGRLVRLSEFDAAAANRFFAEMRAEAEAIVRRGAPTAELTEQRSAFMRYRGQGHEIAVELPVRDFHRCRPAHRFNAVRGGLSPALQPLDSRRRNRDFELGGFAARTGGRRLAAEAVEQPGGSRATVAPRRVRSGRRRNFSTCRSIGAPILRLARKSEGRR